MKPQFKDTVAWQQAELLMQPAFIRVIDHIRQQLERSTWKGSYQDILIWPEGTSEETKAAVTQLRQQREVAQPEEIADIDRALARLPNPYPGYLLCLQNQDRQVNVDLWELCFQVCFRNYSDAIARSDSPEVEIDISLIDEEGDVDWSRLDTKARHLVEQIFTSLPD